MIIEGVFKACPFLPRGPHLRPPGLITGEVSLWFLLLSVCKKKKSRRGGDGVGRLFVGSGEQPLQDCKFLGVGSITGSSTVENRAAGTVVWSLYVSTIGVVVGTCDRTRELQGFYVTALESSKGLVCYKSSLEISCLSAYTLRLYLFCLAHATASASITRQVT
jgi:hypothetical protein